MTIKFEDIQVLFQKRYATKRGPTSSDEFNDMLDEIAHDFLTLNDQWNNRLVPLGNTIPDGTVDSAIDAYTNGLDGANLYVDSDSTASSNSLYYNSSSSRPNTSLEQFDLFYSTMNEIRDDLENQINNTSLSASQISVEDSSALYVSSNVEDALAEVKAQANSLEFLSFGNVGEHILPTADNTYNLGSATLRWANIYVAGSSLHVRALAGEAGGTARDYAFEIDDTDGAFEIAEGVTVISRFLADGGMQIKEVSSAPTEETGFGTIYSLSTDSNLYFKDSSGNVSELGITPTNSNTVEIGADADNNEASSYISMSVDGTEAIRIDENQRVGIGTISPNARLELAHTVPVMRFTDTDTSAYTNLDGSSGDFQIKIDHGNTTVNSDFGVWLDGTRRFAIDSSGNVGIGVVASGNARFHVEHDTISNWHIKTNSDGVSNDSGFWNNSNDIELHLRDASGNSNVILRPNGNSYFNGGDVGIGTASPISDLHVKDTTWCNVCIEATTNDPSIQLTSDGSSVNNDWSMRMDTDGVALDKFQWRYDGVQKMTLDTSGNLGINEITPLGKLHVKSGDAGGDLSPSADADELIIEGSGNAGLSIVSDETTGISAVHFGDQFNSANGRVYYVNSSNDMGFQTAGATKMYILDTGEVGIGTTAPSHLLTVGSSISNNAVIAINGANAQNQLISFRTAGEQRWNMFSNNTSETGSDVGSDFRLNAYDDDEVYLSTPIAVTRATGHVGIGTVSPDAPLEISTTTDVGKQAVTIDQNDVDEPFVDFQGTTGANTTSSISTHGTPGTIQGWIQIEINGTKRWIPFYDNPSA